MQPRADEEGLDELRRIFVAKPRPTSWPERRARMDEVCSLDAPPAEVVFTPAEIGGVPSEWSCAPGSDAGRVLVYFHGGGYCAGSLASHRGLLGALGRAAGLRTLAVGYRLAPEHPHPAALQDALAVYRALRAEGLAAERIALGGDSAGGGLTLACLLGLRQAGQPLPACAWLISPWVDLAMRGASLASKAAIDPLIQRDYLQGLADAYLAGASPANPLVSPLYADLQGLPPTLVQVGSSETLLDDALGIAGRLGAAEVPVSLEVWPRMIHAWHLWWRRLPAGAAAIRSAAAFLRANLTPTELPEAAPGEGSQGA